MIELTLTTWERVTMRNLLLVQPQGNTFAEAELGLEVLQVLKLSDEEQQTIGFKELAAGATGWSEEKDRSWPILFPEKPLKFLVGRIFHPKAVGWTYDEKNRPLKAKMEAAMNSSSSPEKKK